MNKKHNQRPTKNVPVTDSKSGQTRNLNTPVNTKTWLPDGSVPPISSSLQPQVIDSVDEAKAANDADSLTTLQRGQDTSSGAEGLLNAEGSAEQNANSSASESKERKKPDYKNLADYLQGVFAGKAKSLPDDVFNKLRIGSPTINPDERGVLLRYAQENDHTLEKTRQLFIYARRTGSHRAWGRAIREFARDVVRSHLVVRGCSSVSLAFSGSEDEQGIKQFWNELYPQGYNAIASIAKAKPDVEVEATEPELLGIAKSSKIIAKARRNAFLCSVLWRHGENLEVTADLMHLYGETLFRHSTKLNLDTDLIDGLATLPEREEEKIAQVMAWASGQASSLQARTADYARKLQSATESLELLQAAQAELELRNLESLKMIQSKEQELSDMVRDICIQKTHSRADFESLRANSLGVIKSAVAELENVDIALSRENPKTEFARDVLKAVIDNLLKQVGKLDEKKS